MRREYQGVVNRYLYFVSLLLSNYLTGFGAGAMSSGTQIPIEGAVTNGEGTTEGPGTATLQEHILRISIGESSFDCSLDAIERVSIDSDLLHTQFERGAHIQWTDEQNRYRATLEPESSVGGFLRRLSGRALDGTQIRIEQTTSPNKFETDRDVTSETALTTLSIDAERGAVRFDSSVLERIQPTTVSMVRRTSAAGDGRALVQIKEFTIDRTITSRLTHSSDRRANLLRDHVVNSYRLAGTGGPIHMLTVDDEPGIADVTKQHLEEKHPELVVEFATSTSRAVDMIRRNSFECIVTDYAMPDGGAPDILDAALEQTPTVPVIVFSRKDPDTLPGDQPSDRFRAWLRKETGTDQYHRIAQTVKRVVALRRSVD